MKDLTEDEAEHHGMIILGLVRAYAAEHQIDVVDLTAILITLAELMEQALIISREEGKGTTH